MVRRNRFSQEVRERAVRMLGEHRADYGSEWEAIRSIAEKIGIVMSSSISEAACFSFVDAPILGEGVLADSESNLERGFERTRRSKLG